MKIEYEANSLIKDRIREFRTGDRPTDSDAASLFDACQTSYLDKVSKVEVTISDFNPKLQETAKKLGLVDKKPYLRLTVTGRKH